MAQTAVAAAQVEAPDQTIRPVAEADPAVPALARLGHRRPWMGLLPRSLRDPLLRNGHLLTLSAAIAGGVGLIYWSLAAHDYDTVAVGQGSSAVSALLLLGGVANFNLMSTLMRFVPTRGAAARRLVIATYAIASITAGGLATGFVLVIGRVSPTLAFFDASPLVAAAFVVAAVLWTISVLQDAALTATRDAPWVVAENATMGVAKVALVVVLATALPTGGILLSWTGGLVVSGIVANAYLFGRAFPRRRSLPATENLGASELVRFAGPDYLASLLWLAAIAALPLVAVAEVGATQYAYFAVAWALTYMLYQASANLGYSLTVETAGNPMAVPAHWMRLIRHVGPLLVGVVAVVIIGAPLLLAPFGSGYAAHGATTLRLLALSALPNLITSSAVSVARACKRTVQALVMLAGLCILVIAISLLLMPSLGIVGVGVAWLVGQSLVAIAVLALRRYWLYPTGFRGTLLRGVGAPGSRGSEVRTLSMANEMSVMAVASDDGPIGVLKRPSGPHATAELAAEHRAIDALHRDPRLDGWDLHPKSCWMHDAEGQFLLQTWVPGTGGLERITRRPDELRALVAAAFGEARRLHERTAREMVISERLAAAWIDDPLRLIGELGRRPSVTARPQRLTQLGRELRRNLKGRTAMLGRVHGDLWLGNVLYDAAGSVSGFVDWGQSGDRQIIDLDQCNLGLTTWAAHEGESFGAVTIRCLRAGGWTRLTAGHLGLDRQMLAHRSLIDERTVVLLTWLRHVSMNLTKASHYRENPVWLWSNVGKPLRAATAQRPSG